MSEMKAPIAMAEEYWANTQLSVVRHYGQMQFAGKHYVIVNKEGVTIFELSNPKGEHYVGDDQMAIPPGEPCDLVMFEWVPIYKALGRDAFLAYIKDHDNLEAAQKYVKQLKQ